MVIEARNNVDTEPAACNARYMSGHPIVLKYYAIAANFPRLFRYNDVALVYSGLLAGTRCL